jgi:hypothetical protein
LKAIIVKKIEALDRQDDAPAGETEMHLAELTDGMVLSRDVRSGTGLLIIARGVVLDQKIIGALQRYYRMDPPRTGIFVKKQYKGQQK